MGLERLYYTDSNLVEFDASVVEIKDGGLRVLLDRTAFYPTSGGQPQDTGTLNNIRVLDVMEEDGRVWHVLASPIADGAVHGLVDWDRRFDHMQQHTGQHLLSAVFEELYAYKTVSFHLGTETSTIDLETPEVSPDEIAAAELRANQIIAEDRPVGVSFVDAEEVSGLRKASEREGTLRIVSIQDFDRSACGGTHLASTGRIGCVLVRKQEKMRGNARLEFLCGLRAVRQTRRDYEILTKIARLFTAAPEETPGLVAAVQEQAREAVKDRRKLAIELAIREGREIYEVTRPDERGVRRHAERLPLGPLPDEVRTRAQAFTAQSHAVYLAATEKPATVLLAVSADLGLHAGNLLKQALQGAGGRGGGSAQMAQGTVPGDDELTKVIAALAHL